MGKLTLDTSNPDPLLRRGSLRGEHKGKTTRCIRVGYDDTPLAVTGASPAVTSVQDHECLSPQRVAESL